ncbi:MAG: COX15/CtaA family protein [Planctomycetota bacterium]|nr:COX15/CtaA family protein [Planctomycetota bacterium]
MPAQARPQTRLYILTAGFGATVAMWFVGYVCRIPPAVVPAPLVLTLMLACLFAAGIVVGRHTRAGWKGGALAGCVAAVLNLLILGSLLFDPESEQVAPAALVWVPGSIVLGAALAALGALAGSLNRARSLTFDEWRSGFVLVAGAATLLVVVAGGLVTSWEEGLAVPDWPNSFGMNMFLYPMSRMTGGIYYEHAHRLYGSLVGLTTIILAIVLWRSDDRAWLRWLALLAVLMVIGQGIMGGLRVTGSPTLAEQPDTEPSLTLAIIHGVFGQVFLVVVLLLWAFTTRRWREARAEPTASAGIEGTLLTVLVALALVQLVFGALYRHLFTESDRLPWPGLVHIALAAVVAMLAYAGGLRAWVKYPHRTVLKRLGVALIAVVSIQLLLGLAALIAILVRREGPNRPEVWLATAHQAGGAIVFILAVQLLAWTRRLLRPTKRG